MESSGNPFEKREVPGVGFQPEIAPADFTPIERFDFYQRLAEQQKQASEVGEYQKKLIDYYHQMAEQARREMNTG